MDAKNRVIDSPTVHVGGANSCTVDPKTIFSKALQCGATSLIVAHNHPSGDTRPSRDDIKTTVNLQRAAELLGIELLDHLILGRDHYSLKQAREI